MGGIVFLAGAVLIAIAGPLYAGCFRSHAVNLTAEMRAGRAVGVVGVVLVIAGLVLFLVGAS